MFGNKSVISKKFLKVNRKDLHVGHRNLVKICCGESVIYMDRGRSEEMFECFLNGPYEVECVKQMSVVDFL